MSKNQVTWRQIEAALQNYFDYFGDTKNDGDVFATVEGDEDEFFDDDTCEDCPANCPQVTINLTDLAKHITDRLRGDP